MVNKVCIKKLHLLLTFCLISILNLGDLYCLSHNDFSHDKRLLPACYLQELEEQGYCVIPKVLSRQETQQLYIRMWKEFIEQAWPECQMEKINTWEKHFPIQNKMGIFSGPAGQTQVMWDLRQDKRIVQIFAEIWGTSIYDLVVSMDGISLMCPPEIRKGYVDAWMHVDQSTLIRQDGTPHNNTPESDFVSESPLATNPYTIQGQFLFEDSFDKDAGFYCIPKSHLAFSELSLELEKISQIKNGKKRRAARTAFLEKFVTTSVDSSGSNYKKIHVEAEKGSLILWDSRTVHWNQNADPNRNSTNKPRVRMVGYLCYVPKKRLMQEQKALRKQAFEQGVSTGHNPCRVELKYTKDHIWEEYQQHQESDLYIAPKIHLSALGKSLLGLDPEK